MNFSFSKNGVTFHEKKKTTKTSNKLMWVSSIETEQSPKKRNEVLCVPLSLVSRCIYLFLNFSNMYTCV